MTENFRQELRITFVNPEGTSRFELKYLLRPGDFTRRWAAELRKTLDSDFTLQEGGVFYGSLFQDRSSLVQRMAESSAVINARWPGAVTYLPREEMDQDYLSHMHAEFERIELAPGYHQASPEIHRAARALNLLIHRYEGFFSPPECAHVALNFEPVQRTGFTDADYELFETGLKAGTLILPYGVTGVPVLSAYQNNHPARPVPQSNFTPSMELCFEDRPAFQDYDGLREWLKRWDMKLSDPGLALGYIPLGDLHPESPPKEEILKRLAAHQKVEKVRLGNPGGVFTSTATWPTHPEIFRHLQIAPYILLPHAFDHEGCLEEGLRLLERFVKHRGYDQRPVSEGGGEWKSLAIHALNGDSTKTQYHVDYGVKEPSYSLSDVAEYCPRTMRFLEQFTDIKSCERIRFMLLEPGAEIRAHSDAKDKDVSLAFNIALNMPDGCEFMTGLNADGSPGVNTRRIPIREGTIFLFNNAPYHRVRNESQTPRLHMIVHGPAKISDQTLIDAARAQNGVAENKDLVNRLVRARAGYGLKIDRALHDELAVSGVNRDLIPAEFALGILDDEIEDRELRHEALHLITAASLFPHNHEVVLASDLDRWLGQQADSGRSVAVVIAAGTRVNSCVTFPIELIRAAQELKKAGAMIMGHIMDRKKEIPHLHEQFFLVDLFRWDKAGRPTFGRLYSDEVTEFPHHERSKENVHDDYTPWWLKPGDKVPARSGKAWLGTRAMAVSLRLGLPVINVPMDLRVEKKFSYPRSGRGWQYAEIRKEIDGFLAGEKRKIYVFNNERPFIRKYGQFTPDEILSPCAGLKAFSLVHQFWMERPARKVRFIDHSAPASGHFARLMAARSIEDIQSVLEEELKRQTGNPESAKLAAENFRRWKESVFAGDQSRFNRVLDHITANHEITVGDFVGDHSVIVDRVQPGVKTLFWHSNAWSSNASLYLYSADDLTLGYEALGRKIAAKLGVPAWRHRFEWEIIFGETPAQPVMVMTDGCNPSPAPSSDYRELV